MSDFAFVLMLAGGTFLMRASLIVLLADAHLSERTRQALQLVAPAVLAGLVAETLVIEDGSIRPIDSWYLAAIVAAIVFLAFRREGESTWSLAGDGSASDVLVDDQIKMASGS